MRSTSCPNSHVQREKSNFFFFFLPTLDPNLLLFMGVCVTDKELLIVAEFLNEGNVEEKILGPSDISLFSRVRWARQAAGGLSWLHSSGVMHMDIVSW